MFSFECICVLLLWKDIFNSYGCHRFVQKGLLSKIGDDLALGKFSELDGTSDNGKAMDSSIFHNSTNLICRYCQATTASKIGCRSVGENDMFHTSRCLENKNTSRIVIL